MTRVSQKSVRKYGISLGAVAVPVEVGQAIIAEGRRLRLATASVASEILQQWYKLDYLPAQEAKKKGDPIAQAAPDAAAATPPSHTAPV